MGGALPQRLEAFDYCHADQEGEVSEAGEDALDRLLTALCVVVEGPDGSRFDRPNIIRLLSVLAAQLGEHLQTPLGTLDDGTEVVGEHPAVTQLWSLVQALKDLDRGLTDEVLRPCRDGATASLPWRLRNADRALIDLLRVFEKAGGFSTRKDAAEALARKLRKRGYRRKGQAVSARQLINLNHRRRKI